MIDELNQLATRIQQLVARMQVLSSETQALKQQVTELASERDGLAAELQAGNTRMRELHTSLGSATEAAESTRVKAEREKTTLQGTLDLFRQEHETTQTNLKAREHEVKRLREVNEQAKQRIEGVLERLPGATQQEAS